MSKAMKKHQVVSHEAMSENPWEELVRQLHGRYHAGNPYLLGFFSGLDPRPRMMVKPLSEAEGMWADWASLGCDLRSAMDHVARHRLTG